MKRQGWTFCLGLLVSGTVMAQPPADSERYPPAPELPGVVVSQTTTGQPIGKVVPIAGQTPSPSLAKPMPAPTTKPIAPPTEKLTPPSSDFVETQGYPIETAAPACATCAPSMGLLSGGKHLDCVSRIREWLCFRSRAKQQGHYVTPYYFPLQAWFPCDPKRRPSISSSCSTCQTPAAVGSAPVTTNPDPVVVPQPPEMPAPRETLPLGPSPKSGVLAPLPIPPALAGTKCNTPPLGLHIPAGVTFTPGISPMANPTSQTERVSTWRPK